MGSPTEGFVGPPVQTYVDSDGRQFGYVHVRHAGASGLGIHFSAFFGTWGDYKQYRDTFAGYFHRLRMLGSDQRRNWLFLCDTFGAFGNGTYYTGEKGDFFVERAMLAIIDQIMIEDGVSSDRVVTVGSSMGGTAALKFGLLRGVKGIVAIGPHIDLDVCARLQNRAKEVAFICPDGDPAADHNHVYTRQIRSLLSEGCPPPRLFMQVCADDRGLYEEQVLPLVIGWRAAGGSVDLDVRPIGGHTSDWATRPLLIDAVDRLAEGQAIDVAAYQSDEDYRGSSCV